MPTFNGERYIAEALHSLIGPNRPDEVIVVDDGSTDRTLAIVESFSDRLPLRVLAPRPEHSWPAMTNIGLAGARGRWSSILHQDDRWLPSRASRSPFLEQDTDLVVSDAIYIDEGGREIGRWRIPRSVRRRPERFASALYVQNWIAVPAATFRTDAALNAGGLDDSLWYTADWDLWLKLAKRRPPVCAPGACAAFRLHSGSQTVAGSAKLREQLETVQERHGWAVESRRTQLAAQLSTETNVLLGAALKGQAELATWARAAIPAVARGAGLRYLRDSGITDRLTGRLRARLRN